MAMNEIKIFKKSMSHRDIVMKASYANFHMMTMMLGILPRSVSRHPEFQFIHLNGLSNDPSDGLMELNWVSVLYGLVLNP